jgi:hypothetical protein
MIYTLCIKVVKLQQFVYNPPYLLFFNVNAILQGYEVLMKVNLKFKGFFFWSIQLSAIADMYIW